MPFLDIFGGYVSSLEGNHQHGKLCELDQSNWDPLPCQEEQRHWPKTRRRKRRGERHLFYWYSKHGEIQKLRSICMFIHDRFDFFGDTNYQSVSDHDHQIINYHLWYSFLCKLYGHVWSAKRGWPLHFRRRR